VVGHLTIQNNPQLSQCCQLLSVIQATKGIVSISGNAANCNSQAEIAAACGPKVCEGDVTLTTQAEVDAFNCSEVTGNLIIKGADITDLTPLASLTKVGGFVDISNNADLSSFSGLENLASVGGNLYITSNSTLSSLAGLENLTFVGGYLNIQNNSSLSSLVTLKKLTSVVGDINIQNNSSLSSLAGLENLTSVENLYIVSNSSLSSLAGLENLTSVVGHLTIQNNSSLSSLAGLENLTSVGGGLYIESNDVLSSLAGLEKLTSVGKSLRIHNNAGLSSLTGLGKLASVGENFYIRSNANLSSLAGLENLASVGALMIYENASLSSLAGLKNLASVESIQIVNNAVLSGLSGLGNIASVGGHLYIGSNPLLNSLVGLGNLASMGGHLIIESNSMLSSLAGLEKLVLVGGALDIESNPTMSSLAGLENLASVGGPLYIYSNNTLSSVAELKKLASVGGEIIIANNPQLSQCCLLLPLLQAVKGTVTITGNATGCKSKAAIEVACAPVTITAQPQSATGCVSTKVTFSVVATGSNLSFKWLKNGQAITGATASTYEITAVTVADAAEYLVEVSSSSGGGKITSEVATLTVHEAPATPTIAGTTSFCAGGSTLLTSSAATGNQWYRNGALIEGQTSKTLSVSAVGSYTVVVTNASNCSATAMATTVTENALPQVTLKSSDADDKINAGESVTFTATSATAANYEFFVGETSVQSSASNTYVTIKLTNGQVVSVKVTTESGCSATHTGITTTVNAIPEAKADAYQVDEGQTLTIAVPGVLSNDTDANKDPLTAAVVPESNVAHGSLTLSRDGSFTYTPALNYNGPDAFTYLVSDGNGGTAKATVTLTVNTVNDAPVVTTNKATQQVQYSDPVTAVTIKATDADNSYNTLTASTSWKVDNGAFVSGLPASLTLSSPTGAGTWSLSGNMQVAPGTYTIRVSVNDGTGEAANNSGYTDVVILVTPENAVADYTGAQSVATSSATSGTALLTLSATLRDITAVTSNPLTDANAGDIRMAKVRFLLDNVPVVNTNSTNGATTDAQGWTSVVLVNATDIKTGTVLVKAPVNIGTADAQQYTIRVEVSGYYTAEEETQVLNVYKPLNDFVTGGGYIIPTKSSGTYASDAGRKTNFGFNVKYNKSGKSLQGNINTIFRRKEKDGLVHVYQIKGNSMTSLSVNAKVATAKTAIFNGKANLQDITNPQAPVSVGGNLTLQVSMTDKGEPGKNDLLGITVFSSTGGILYASNWDGVKTAEMLLSGGNIIINSGSLTTGTTSPTTAAKTAVNPGATEVFTAIQPTLTAYPNPVADKATIEFSFAQDEAYAIAIYDLKGTLVKQLPNGKAKANEQKQVAWQVGNAAAGLYIVRLTTANAVQQLKLMVE